MSKFRAGAVRVGANSHKNASFLGFGSIKHRRKASVIWETAEKNPFLFHLSSLLKLAKPVVIKHTLTAIQLDFRKGSDWILKDLLEH